MRKVILMMLLAVISSSAMAEWVAIGQTDSLIVYVDPATIRKDGSKAKIWRMFDYKSSQTIEGITFLSWSSRDEYSCEEGQLRQLASNWFSGNIGSGDVVALSNEPTVWREVRPGSTVGSLMQIACGKTKIK